MRKSEKTESEQPIFEVGTHSVQTPSLSTAEEGPILLDYVTAFLICIVYTACMQGGVDYESERIWKEAVMPKAR